MVLAASLALDAGSVAAQSAGTFAPVSDTLEVVHDQVFASTTAVLLANDMLRSPGSEDDSLQAVVVTPPSHGVVTVSPSGALSYTPEPGFVGTDSFTYVLQSLPIQVLQFAPASSNLEFESTLRISLGSDSARKTIPINGSVRLDVGDGTAPIDSVHVLSISVRNDAQIALQFKYGSPITVGKINLSAAKDSLKLDINRVGPRADASGAFNSFTQTGNKLNVETSVDMSGTGVLSNAVPNDPQHLVTETDFDVVGSVLTQPGTLAFVFNVDSHNQFQISGNDVDLNITGTAVATGPYVQRVTSDPATVTLHVISPTEIENRTLPERNRLLSLYPNPAAGETTISYEIARPGPVRFAVFDLLGRRRLVVFASSNVTGEQVQRLDLSHVSPGLYFVRVSQSAWSATRSLIVR